MDGHRIKLSLLYRICSDTIKLVRGYVEAKHVSSFKEILKNAFNIDVQEDDLNIHPQTVCNKCYLKLYRLQKKPKKELSVSTPCTFNAHSDSCEICEPSKVGRKKSTDSKLPSVRKIAENFKFEHCELSNGSAVYTLKETVSNNVIISKSIFVDSLGDWYISLFQNKISKDADFYYSLPAKLEQSSAEEIFSKLEIYQICPGNNDFQDLIDQRLLKIKPQNFISAHKTDAGVMETNTMQTWDSLSVIRHVDCVFLVEAGTIRCSACSTYRKTLHAMMTTYRRKSTEEEPVKDSSKVNDRYLSKTEMMDKLKFLEREKRILTSKNIRLQNKVRNLIEHEGIIVDDNTNQLVKAVQNDHEVCPFETDSPQALLWEQQKIQANTKDK